MISVHVRNFDEWRKQAKQCLFNNTPPENIIWQSDDLRQKDLFGEATLNSALTPTHTVMIPKAFVELSAIVSCHQNPDKWQLLYQALWRITHDEKHLLFVASDSLVNKLNLYRKAISRDMHKMKAFVRFQQTVEAGEEFFIAWYKPDHHIVRKVAPFFQKRFSVMNWCIMTPDETVTWNKQELIYSAGVPTQVTTEDEIENLWCSYYKSIFNPARVKVKAMRAEMPTRYWHTMPETKLIPGLIKDAPRRAAVMLEHQEGFGQSAVDFFPKEKTLSNLRTADSMCQACELHSCAKQTVFGAGPEKADFMLIGEQPGQQEDEAGEPFVGPAGQVLREIIEESGLSLSTMYLTNVVKHFKHEIQYDRKLHRTPNVREVNACKPWVAEEIKVVQPKVILCLGNTAAKALLAPGFAMSNNRGQWLTWNGVKAMATYHPSAILRQPNEARKYEMRAALAKDLSEAYAQSK